MNNKEIRINKAVAFLKGAQIIKFQKDIMDAMKADKTTVSQALSGNEKYLTDKFMTRFAEVYPDINAEWLLTGDGQMLNTPTQEEIAPSKQAGEISIPQEAWAIIRDQAASLKAKDEQLNKVIAMLEDQLNKKGETAGNAGAAVG